MHGKLGGCAPTDGGGARAVEQAHGGFEDEEISSGRGFIGDVVKELSAHGPAIEIEARCAGGSGVEGRVDIVGAAFGGADAQATAAEGGKQSERDGGLACAGARRSNQQSFGLR